MAVLPPDPRYLLRGDMGCVHSVVFWINPYVEHLFAGTESGKVYVWDLKRNRELQRLKVGEDSTLNLRVTGEHELLVQQKCGDIKVHKLSESQWVHQGTYEADFCNYCRFQALSDNSLFVPLKDSAVGLLSLKSLSLEYKLEAKRASSPEKLGEPMVLKVVDEGLLLVAYEGGRLLLWDLRKLEVLGELEVEACPMALDFEATLRRGVVGGPSESVLIFNLSTSQALSERSRLTLKNPGTSVARVRPDGKVLSIGGWDGRVRIFSWKNLRSLAALDQHRASVHDICYSDCKVQAYDDKILMATGGKDGCVALWDIYN